MLIPVKQKRLRPGLIAFQSSSVELISFLQRLLLITFPGRESWWASYLISPYVLGSAVGFVFQYVIRRLVLIWRNRKNTNNNFRRRFSWWTKYNCEFFMEKTSPAIVNIPISLVVLAAALDSGLAVSILFIFFTLQYPKSDTVRRYHYVALIIYSGSFDVQIIKSGILTWWGYVFHLWVSVWMGWTNLSYSNTVPFTGADGRGIPVKSLAPGEKFGWVLFIFLLVLRIDAFSIEGIHRGDIPYHTFSLLCDHMSPLLELQYQMILWLNSVALCSRRDWVTGAQMVFRQANSVT